MNPVIDLLFSHRSIRRFTEQPIADALLQEILRAGQAAATSSFLQGATIIRVRKPESRSKIAAWSGNQVHVEKAAEFHLASAQEVWEFTPEPLLPLNHPGLNNLHFDEMEANYYYAAYIEMF